ncbi:tol-pal system protein YbgF [Thiorhodovibrio winogradskyi]|uniref:Cell division coordinator CpoB n=1 Tax=Thiorhodovibrio winogradskyi TaxID=77007 RepID=A0ABZ0SEG8_9GAMM|nr:tol-pal system protein YbgF [Thiorhodovibrio winogradskyi]
MTRYHIGLLAAGLFVLGPLVSDAASADPMLEARIAKLERMLSEQRLSDVLLQIQQLQQEVQDLRGIVEKQQFQLRRQGQGRSPDSPGGDAQNTGMAEGMSPDPPVQHLSPDGVTNPPPWLGVPGPNTEPNPNWQGLDARPSSGTHLELTPEDTLLPALPAPETQGGGERDAYRDAFEHLKARDYEAARVAFENLLQTYPRGDFADNSRYWLGEISYQSKDYPEARAAFEQLMQEYPSSPKVPGAMLKLGYLDSDLGNLDQARAMLQAVMRRFPNTAEGRLAAQRLADINKTIDNR